MHFDAREVDTFHSAAQLILLLKGVGAPSDWAPKDDPFYSPGPHSTVSVVLIIIPSHSYSSTPLVIESVATRATMGPKRARPETSSPATKTVRFTLPPTPTTSSNTTSTVRANATAADQGEFRFGFSFDGDQEDGHGNDTLDQSHDMAVVLPNVPLSCRYVVIRGHYVGGPEIGQVLRVDWDKSSHFFLRLIGEADEDDDDPDGGVRQYDAPPSKVRMVAITMIYEQGLTCPL